MRAEVIQGTPQRLGVPGQLQTIIYTNPVEIPNVLPPGATVADVLLPSTEAPSGLTEEALKRYLGMGQAITDGPAGAFVQNTFNLPAIDWQSGLASVGAGAAIGGPIGAVVGGVVWAVQSFMLAPHVPVLWQGAGPGVHAWFTVCGPEGFLQWVRDSAPGALASVRDCQTALIGWAVEHWRVCFVQGQRTYIGIDDSVLFTPPSYWEQYGDSNPSGEAINTIRNWPGGSIAEWVPDVYAQMGIDYAATKESRNAGRPGFMLISLGLAVTSQPQADTPTIDRERGDEGEPWYNEVAFTLFDRPITKGAVAMAGGVAGFGALLYLASRKRPTNR